jgi:hypothetical protein
MVIDKSEFYFSGRTQMLSGQGGFKWSTTVYIIYMYLISIS